MAKGSKMKFHPASQWRPTEVQWWIRKVATTATPHKQQGSICWITRHGRRTDCVSFRFSLSLVKRQSSGQQAARTPSSNSGNTMTKCEQLDGFEQPHRNRLEDPQDGPTFNTLFEESNKIDQT